MIKEMENKTREELIAQRIIDSETRVFKAVFPGDTNHHKTMFGGAVMYLMDEIAFMTATRFCRKPIVTVSSDKIDFKHSIPAKFRVKRRQPIPQQRSTQSLFWNAFSFRFYSRS